MKQKVYLAGPMRGIPKFNFPLFLEAEKKLTALGYNVFSPAAKDTREYGSSFSDSNESGSQVEAEANFNFSLRKALSMDLQYICEEAEGIVMLPGWIHSKGAVAEKATAEALNIPVLYYEKMV
jgi:hypothetical protein